MKHGLRLFLMTNTTTKAPTVPGLTYSERKGWTGADARTLYAITDKRTGTIEVLPGDQLGGVGPVVTIRVATRIEAEYGWQRPLHAGWTVAPSEAA